MTEATHGAIYTIVLDLFGFFQYSRPLTNSEVIDLTLRIAALGDVADYTAASVANSIIDILDEMLDGFGPEEIVHEITLRYLPRE